jgi:hypothetical protein
MIRHPSVTSGREWEAVAHIRLHTSRRKRGPWIRGAGRAARQPTDRGGGIGSPG